MGVLGSLYRNTDNDKAISLLNTALKMAEELKDSTDLYWYKELLSRAYYLVGEYEKSKQIAVDAISSGKNYVHEETFFNAALAYAKLGHVDSARYYTPNGNNNDYHYLAMEALVRSTIAEAAGNLRQALIENHKYEAFSDSALLDSVRINTLLNENITAKQNSDKHKNKNLLMKKMVVIAILFSFFIITVLSLFYFNKKRHLNKIIVSLQGQKINLHNDLIDLIDQNTTYYAKIKENEDQNVEKAKEIKAKEIDCNALRKLVSKHVSLMKKLVESSEHDTPRVFDKVFKDAVKDYSQEDSQMEAFVNFANQNFNNVVNKASQLSLKLTLKEKYIIALMAAGFDYKEISLLTGYTSNFVGEKRTRIQKKLGLDCRLIDFIKKSKEN